MAISSRIFFYLIIELLIHFNSFSQEKELKIPPKYQYNQIDSLVTGVINNAVQRGSSYVVANTEWLVGSYYQLNDEFEPHRNHFNIYVFYFVGKNAYMEKIDNYSFFKKEKIKGKKIKKFIKNNFEHMKNETLSAKTDSSFNSQGNLIVTEVINDHQLVNRIKIFKNGDSFGYKFPNSYLLNKKNLETSQFLFLRCIYGVLKHIKQEELERVW